MPLEEPLATADSSRRGSSPYSSGGGGVTLERRVAALYLARLLIGATSVELGKRRVTRVEFQRVDDLVIYASRDGEAETSLELGTAVRRAPDFVTSDTKTEKLLAKFLPSLGGAESAGTGVDRRFAICVAGVQTASRQVGELADLAKVHDVLDSERRRNARGWAELTRLDQDARAAVRSEMGVGPASARLHLSRTAMAEALRKRIDERSCVLVWGESGVGKSALALRQLSNEIESAPDMLQAFFLNLRLLPPTISDLRNAIGGPVEGILSEMSASRRLLVIDAAEYILETSPDLLSYLVRAAKTSDVGVWVIATTEGCGAVRSTFETISSPIIEHEISPLTDFHPASRCRGCAAGAGTGRSGSGPGAASVRPDLPLRIQTPQFRRTSGRQLG